MEIYNKYKIEHTDGTPLKGKRYFVLRLDSDNPEEAARVEKAMRAYQEKLRNCDVGTAKEQWERFDEFCEGWQENSPTGGCSSFCPCLESKYKECDGWVGRSGCFACWAQMPYEPKGEANAIQ